MISGAFAADFANFFDACTKAEVSLKGFETGSVKVEAQLNRMADSLSGVKIVQQATLAAAAVEKIGGVSKLTEADLARFGATAQAAADKLRALGEDVPAKIQNLADRARGAAEETLRLGDAARNSEPPLTAMGVAAGTIAGQLVLKATGALLEFGQQAVLTSARVESLGSVARFMGAQAGFTAGEIDALVAALRAQGITSQQANDTVIQMTRANMSLADATGLATVAQSLARATNQNSSDVMGQLIRGVQTLQVETLRNAGVVIQLDQEYVKFAATHGRVVTSLGAEEKQQIALAAVLREGERVAGVYGVTNENVGGKLQSLARYQEEAGNAVGHVFLPALKVGVEGLTDFYKVVQQAPDVFAALGLGIVGIGTAFTAFKTASALGVISSGAMTTALGLLWPVVAVGATAFVSWKLGTWIGEVTGLTDGVARLAGRMMGLSSADLDASIAARKYAESAEGQAAAVAAQAKNLADLEAKAKASAAALALKAQADAAAAAAQKLAEEEAKKFAAAWTELNSIGATWKETIAGINPVFAEQITYYLKAGASQATLAAAYPVTASQVKGLAERLKEYGEVLKTIRTLEEGKNEAAAQGILGLSKLDQETSQKRMEADGKANGMIIQARAALNDGIAKATLSSADYQIRQIENTRDAAIAAFKAQGAGADQVAQYTAIVTANATRQIDAVKATLTSMTDQGIQDMMRLVAANEAAMAKARATSTPAGTGTSRYDANGNDTWGVQPAAGATTPGSSFGAPVQYGSAGGVVSFRASGGPVSAGQPYWVGEKGPELYTPGANGFITPNGGGGGVAAGAIVINLYGTPAALAQQVKAIVTREILQGRKLNA